MRTIPNLFISAILSLACFQNASGQIKFTEAYPKVRFNRPVYFGAFPGKPNTNVILEAHTGLALLVYQKGPTWVIDTLVKLDVHQASEMGFLGIAFHPNFVKNRRYYVSYNPPGSALFNVVDERIADSTLMKDSGNKPRNLFNIPDKYENHNGGTIAFSPKDSCLYYGTGDGGSGFDPDNNGQNLNALLGKFLRVDVDRQDPGLPYGIPTDNPFAITGGRPEIYAVGMRNPWKWSFDPLNGDLWAGDVGQREYEEVSIITLGGNYGWKIMEGPIGTNNGKMSLPVFSYNREAGTCIIGGVVFRGNVSSKYYGAYVTADINTLKFWVLKKTETGNASLEDEGVTPTGLSSFGTDAEGRIYAVGIYNGVIYYLDSPDLQPNTSIKNVNGSRGNYGRTFSASPGTRLQPSAFRNAAVLEIFNSAGVHVGQIRKESPRIPESFEPGVYILRAKRGSFLPEVLVVR